MKNKALKIAAITLGSVIGLIIVAMIAIPYFFKDKIIAAALDAANESLTAKIVVEPSDIDFSLFSEIRRHKTHQHPGNVRRGGYNERILRLAYNTRSRC